MATVATTGKAAARRRIFVPHHPRDRTMAAVAAVAVVLAIALGFGIDIVRRAHTDSLHFSLVTHLHAVAYTGWIALFAVQVWLVRVRRVVLHRRVGRLAVLLLPAMAVLGPATAYLGVAGNPSMPDKWIAWLSVNFTNALGGIALLAWGYARRFDAAAHKRLMILGTIALTEPGFSRIWLATLETWLGEGYLPFWIATYIGSVVLIAGMGAYDLATRRRLHPAYVAGALWIFANEAVADYLFHQPWWLAAMKRLTGLSA